MKNVYENAPKNDLPIPIGWGYGVDCSHFIFWKWYSFTVGIRPIYVTELGYYNDVGYLANGASHEVAIYNDSTQAQVGSVATVVGTPATVLAAVQVSSLTFLSPSLSWRPIQRTTYRLRTFRERACRAETVGTSCMPRLPVTRILPTALRVMSRPAQRQWVTPNKPIPPTTPATSAETFSLCRNPPALAWLVSDSPRRCCVAAGRISFETFSFLEFGIFFPHPPPVRRGTPDRLTSAPKV